MPQSNRLTHFKNNIIRIILHYPKYMYVCLVSPIKKHGHRYFICSDPTGIWNNLKIPKLSLANWACFLLVLVDGWMWKASICFFIQQHLKHSLLRLDCTYRTYIVWEGTLLSIYSCIWLISTTSIFMSSHTADIGR